MKQELSRRDVPKASRKHWKLDWRQQIAKRTFSRQFAFHTPQNTAPVKEEAENWTCSALGVESGAREAFTEETQLFLERH